MGKGFRSNIREVIAALLGQKMNNDFAGVGGLEDGSRLAQFLPE